MFKASTADPRNSEQGQKLKKMNIVANDYSEVGKKAFWKPQVQPSLLPSVCVGPLSSGAA